MSGRASPRNIVLTGMMGSGKSTVGRLVAKTTCRDYVDTDEMVEAAAGRSIAELFAEQGEAVFRTMERDAVAEAAAEGGRILSLGGGVVMDPRNVRALKATGVIVFVDAPLEQLVERLSSSRKPGKRPLLGGEQDPERLRVRLRELRDQRHAVYVQAADYVLDTQGRSSDAVAQEVYEWARVTPGVLGDHE